MPYIIRPMEIDDIPEVMEIERQCFTTPWPVHAYRRELRDNRMSRYIVAQWVEPGEEVQTTKAEPARQPRSIVRRALECLFQGVGGPPPPVGRETLAGYAGLWLMLDEAHITTIAVRPNLRGQGLGELLLIGLIDLASALGASYLTLEVRISNTVAQNLYRKYGFREEGVRKRYYTDNNEDALIMWSEPINAASFQNRLAKLKVALNQKLAQAKSPRARPTSKSSAAM